MRGQILSQKLCAVALSLGVWCGESQADEKTPTPLQPGQPLVNLVSDYCLDCHSADERSGDLDLEAVRSSDLVKDSEQWEKVARRLRSRQMPPVDALRPEESTYVTALASLEQSLDQIASQNPQPGRVETFRRLTRYEYQNAIRDLLALEIDAAKLLPRDESSHGFDNVTVGELSPTLLNRYLSAARSISRLAIGSQSAVNVETVRLAPDRTQEEHVEGLPLGTRGGALISHTLPQDGEYEIRIRLTRDRDEHVEGLHGRHELDLLLDGDRVKLFTVVPPLSKADPNAEYQPTSHEEVDRHLKTRVSVSAGTHEISVAFLKKPSSLLETQRQPLNVHFNRYRHPRLTPAIFQVSLTGPFNATGPGDTPSRRRIFVCKPTAIQDEESCAREILSQLARRAFRRPLVEADLSKPLELYRAESAERGFEAGIELALSSILVNPQFLFRIERDPTGFAPKSAYRISDLELASRLSFFLWSSLPDDQLLNLAAAGRLADPVVLEQQVRRMLQDERASALVENFAGQWLYLRNLDATSPDMRIYPDFDDNLRQAMKRETQLFFESVLREDRSVLDLLGADYTYLNERLAKHYGIPHVYGSRFRRVALDAESKRGGLLRQGSLLTVTSYATRTSPVLRGKWVLENLLGTPPPPPPENVPALKDNTVAANLSVRERLAEHRANASCATCHDLIDPVGLAFEHYDAVGRWRDSEHGAPVDATGGLPDGSRFVGIEGLEQGLLERPELFVGTIVEKLLTYALGRGVEFYDGPAIREIVRDAQLHDYRFSSLILGVVESVPFQMRTAE